MVTIESGVLDRTRMVSNILMIVLLIGNIFFSIQYAESLKKEAVPVEDKSELRLQASRFLKAFIDIVLNTDGPIAFEDRVKLENDIRQMHDVDLIKLWDAFVGSKDSKAAQENAIKLMSMLATKML